MKTLRSHKANTKQRAKAQLKWEASHPAERRALYVEQYKKDHLFDVNTETWMKRHTPKDMLFWTIITLVIIGMVVIFIL